VRTRKEGKKKKSGERRSRVFYQVKKRCRDINEDTDAAGGGANR
jgi:hypothetical protein